MIPAVLVNAEEDWTGSPLAREVSRFLEARVAAGELLTLAELEQLDARLQPLVRELINGTDVATRAALRPALEQRRRRSTSTSSVSSGVSSLRRAAAGDARRRPDCGWTRSSARFASRPRSVLVVGDPGVGKTTLIVEALRRLGDDRFAFQAGAADVNAGQAFVGMLEARVQEIVDRLSQRPIVWVFPNFEEALWSGQHMQSPRGVLDALLPTSRPGTPSSSARSTHAPTSSSCSTGRGSRGCSRWSGWSLRPARMRSRSRGTGRPRTSWTSTTRRWRRRSISPPLSAGGSLSGNVLRVLELVRDGSPAASRPRSTRRR